MQVSLEDVFSPMEEILLDSLRRWDCDSHVHLFMPDHCHLMLEGRSESSDLWRCVVDFKQRSGYWLSQNGYPGRWQKNFYDHILREGEDTRKQMKYILENPVRKWITDDWRKYPFKGSTIHDFNNWEY